MRRTGTLLVAAALVLAFVAQVMPAGAMSSTATPPAHGTVLSFDMPAPHSGFHARGPFVYLPPAWYRKPRPALPVVVLIGGSPGTPADWTQGAGADRMFDYWAAWHGGVAPVVIMPDVNGSPTADTECVDGPRGRAESYIVDDLRPFMIYVFGLQQAPESWAVAGLSAGATCALTLTLRHPELFGTFADFGGSAAPTVGTDDLRDLYGGDAANMRAHTPANLLRGLRRPQLGGWFEVGSGDYGATQAARTLAPMVSRAGGQSCLVERRGAHDYAFWHDSLRHALPWLIGRVGLPGGDAGTGPCRAEGGRVP